MTRILVVDDEDVPRKVLCRQLADASYEVTDVASIAEAKVRLKKAKFDLILTDLRFGPSESEQLQGMELIRLAAPVPVLILTAHGTVKNAVESMHLGAADYLEKKIGCLEKNVDFSAELVERIERAIDTSNKRAALKSDVKRKGSPKHMIGGSMVMQELRRKIARAAASDAPVLILGEPGTGKELVARAVHEQSDRSTGPWVAENVAAIPEGLRQAELFGTEPGAYSGAISRAGLFEAASKGTLFLDEIGELVPSAQAQLLRVLQESDIRRLGSTQVRRIDIRLITATNRDLSAMVRASEFRADFYHRLRVIEIEVPPLRERKGDIDELANAFLCLFRQRPNVQFAPDARAALDEYDWPGNVRELRNTIDRGVTMCEGDLIMLDDLGLENWPPESGPPPSSNDGSIDDSRDAHIRRVLTKHQHCEGEDKLARRLGISRPTLWRWRNINDFPRPRPPHDKSGDDSK